MKQKDFLIILVPLFILTVLWVVFNIYHNYVTSTIKDPLSIQIIPIEGKFDADTVNKIKNRKKVNPLFEIQAQISDIPTPTQAVSAEPIEVSPTEAPEENQ